jgi:hypothetical protein
MSTTRKLAAGEALPVFDAYGTLYSTLFDYASAAAAAMRFALW